MGGDDLPRHGQIGIVKLFGLGQTGTLFTERPAARSFNTVLFLDIVARVAVGVIVVNKRIVRKLGMPSTYFRHLFCAPQRS